MTEAELSLLKSSIDGIVELETTAGDRRLARILFVFDDGETPDVFYLRVTRDPGGEFVAEGNTGHSLLLSDIASVHLYRP